MSLDIGFASDLGVSPELIQKFYKDQWKRKIALSDNNFYSWQFINPPKNKKKDSCVVAIRKGKIFGVMGLSYLTTEKEIQAIKMIFMLNGMETLNSILRMVKL